MEAHLFRVQAPRHAQDKCPPEAEQGLNMARIGVLLAGLPNTVGGITINRYCSSGINAVQMAPSVWWGEEKLWNAQTIPHSLMLDEKGRVWYAARVRAQLGFAGRVSAGNLIALLNGRIDLFLVLALRGPRAVGVYSIALGISELLWQFSKALALHMQSAQ